MKKRGRPKLGTKARNVTVSFKVSKREFNSLKHKTKIYTSEGMGDYIRMCIFGGIKFGSTAST